MGSLTSGAFASAIKNDTLPTLSFITPNLCNDTHDCAVAVGDAWLSKWVPKILASKAYARGDTAVVITYDEDGFVPNVWVSPSVRPGARFTSASNHYAALRTIEDMLGLAHLGWAAFAPSYRPAFHL
jgi:phospholipase C